MQNLAQATIIGPPLLNELRTLITVSVLPPNLCELWRVRPSRGIPCLAAQSRVTGKPCGQAASPHRKACHRATYSTFAGDDARAACERRSDATGKMKSLSAPRCQQASQLLGQAARYARDGLSSFPSFAPPDCPYCAVDSFHLASRNSSVAARSRSRPRRPGLFEPSAISSRTEARNVGYFHRGMFTVSTTAANILVS